MKINIFLVWFYTQAIFGIVKIWRNFISFFFDYFSVKQLFFTLFFPWKKDVTIHNWRGFQPSKTAQALINNLFSRFVGAIVRTFVIFAGLGLEVFVLVLGILFLFLWVLAPFFLIFIAAGALTEISSILLYSLASLSLLLLIYAYVIYRKSLKKDYREMTLVELYNDGEIFSRIFDRLGVSSADFKEGYLTDQELLEGFLKNLNLNYEDFQNIVEFEINKKVERKEKSQFWTRKYLSNVIPIGRQWRYAYTVKLDEFSVDLTKHIDAEIVGRKNEMEVMRIILNRPNQNNVLLVGDSGIGKKTIIKYFASQIGKRKIPEFEENRVLLFDLNKAISEAQDAGKDIEDFVGHLFEEAIYAGNITLVIEGIADYLINEGGIHHDISSLLSNYLEYPQLRIVATSSLEKYHKLVKRKQNVLKSLEPMELSELSNQESVEVLMRKFAATEREEIIYTYQSLISIVDSSNRYNGNFPLPERAIDLAMEVFVFWQKNPVNLIVPDLIDEFLSIKMGTNIGKIREGEKERLINLEDILHERVIGQNEAVRQVAEALRKIRSGIGDPKKPIGSFLFLGPTGVGKTETAKALSEAYFGDEEKMLRIDMSEFQGENSVERLIGSERSNIPGQLTTKVQDNPFAVLLLDELEKASPNVLNLFLQVLDEGFLTDGFGKRINFRNMIIIATSNAGASLIKDMVEEGKEHSKIKEAVINYSIEEGIYRVEFLNRFDDVIFFEPLKREELKKVTLLLLEKFSKRLYDQKNISITFSEDLAEEILNLGYDPIFGARSVKRYIADNIEDLVAKKIISEEVNKGGNIHIEKLSPTG